MKTPRPANPLLLSLFVPLLFIIGSPGALSQGAGNEILMSDATRPPPFSPGPKVKALPWPFEGKFKDQRIWNIYQQPTGSYIHGGLDFIQSAGTEVKAVDHGEVAVIATNYPDWKTHHFFIVTPKGKTDEGWCYTHVDPDTYTFKLGDKVRKGRVLGKVVDFSIGERDGADHLHLSYVRFKKDGNGKVEVESLLDPLYFFKYEDTEPPLIHESIRLVHNDTFDELPYGDGIIPTVHGSVDIIIAVSDCAYRGQACNWGVSVAAFEIRKGGKTWSKLVLDQRGPLPQKHVSPHLYAPADKTVAWRKELPRWPSSYFMIVTNTDGDGVIEAEDVDYSWSTSAADENGKPLFPNGIYTITVRAWDLKGNKGQRSLQVKVAN